MTANLVNRGTANGASNVSLYINGQVESSRGITVNFGGTAPVTFTISRNEPVTYAVYVNSTDAGSFTVETFTRDTILWISGALGDSQRPDGKDQQASGL